MLSWEYDADVEKRVLAQEARQEGRQEAKQEAVALVAKLLHEGLSYEDALKRITEWGSGTPMQ